MKKKKENITKYVALYANGLWKSFILFIIKMLILADIYSECTNREERSKRRGGRLSTVLYNL